MNEESKEFRVIKKPRSKKLNPRVDLSSMVSISFLLIVFFMVTIQLARPQAMDLGLPDKYFDHDGVIVCGGSDFRRTITLLLDGDDKVISYWGLLEAPNEQAKKLNYGKDGIRRELTRISEQIYQLTGDYHKGPIVIIKPSKKSNYGNLVDILDEMAITKIPTYAIINYYTPEESRLLALK